MEESSSLVMSYVVLYGFRVLAAIAIFVIGKWLAGFASSFVLKMMTKSKVDETLGKFLSKVLYVILLAFVVMSALSQLGVNTTSFLAMFGAAGLAIGLAFKDTFANIGAGVLLIFFRPFKVGDFVTVAGETGTG